MPKITILTEPELRECVGLDSEALGVVSEAFAALASGAVTMPPILRLDVEEHNGEIDVKTAYLKGLDSFAVKMSPGFFDNPKLGLPSVNGLMVLFSARTGLLEAVLLDNGYLTDVRTAAAGGVAADKLARPDCKTAGVIGCGTQGRLQIEALNLVRDIDRVLVWGRESAKAAAYAEAMAAKLGLEVTPVGSAEAVVRESDVVVTTTPSRESLIEAAWLHPGLHITAMGSDSEHKQELAPAVVAEAGLFVCDTKAQSLRLGELHHAVAAGLVDEDAEVVELGQVVTGVHPGRTAPEQVTVCDLTGTGAQDTAIARLAFQKATAAGLGTVIES